MLKTLAILLLISGGTQLSAQTRLVVLPTFSQYSYGGVAGFEEIDGQPYDADSEASKVNQHMSLTVGNVLAGNILLGVTYQIFTKTESSKNTDSSGSDVVIDEGESKETNAGSALTFGYLSSNLKLTFNYFFMFEQKTATKENGSSGFGSYSINTDQEVDGEKAYSMEIAYGYNTGSFTIGPQFTYLKLVYDGFTNTYSNPDTGATATAEFKGGFEETYFIPSLAMWYFF